MVWIFRVVVTSKINGAYDVGPDDKGTSTFAPNRLAMGPMRGKLTDYAVVQNPLFILDFLCEKQRSYGAYKAKVGADFQGLSASLADFYQGFLGGMIVVETMGHGKDEEEKSVFNPSMI